VCVLVLILLLLIWWWYCVDVSCWWWQLLMRYCILMTIVVWWPCYSVVGIVHCTLGAVVGRLRWRYIYVVVVTFEFGLLPLLHCLVVTLRWRYPVTFVYVVAVVPVTADYPVDYDCYALPLTPLPVTVVTLLQYRCCSVPLRYGTLHYVVTFVVTTLHTLPLPVAVRITHTHTRLHTVVPIAVTGQLRCWSAHLPITAVPAVTYGYVVLPVCSWRCYVTLPLRWRYGWCVTVTVVTGDVTLWITLRHTRYVPLMHCSSHCPPHGFYGCAVVTLPVTLLLRYVDWLRCYIAVYVVASYLTLTTCWVFVGLTLQSYGRSFGLRVVGLVYTLPVVTFCHLPLYPTRLPHTRCCGPLRGYTFTLCGLLHCGLRCTLQLLPHVALVTLLRCGYVVTLRYIWIACTHALHTPHTRLHYPYVALLRLHLDCYVVTLPYSYIPLPHIDLGGVTDCCYVTVVTYVTCCCTFIVIVQVIYVTLRWYRLRWCSGLVIVVITLQLPGCPVHMTCHTWIYAFTLRILVAYVWITPAVTVVTLRILDYVRWLRFTLRLRLRYGITATVLLRYVYVDVPATHVVTFYLLLLCVDCCYVTRWFRWPRLRLLPVTHIYTFITTTTLLLRIGLRITLLLRFVTLLLIYYGWLPYMDLLRFDYGYATDYRYPDGYILHFVHYHTRVATFTLQLEFCSYLPHRIIYPLHTHTHGYRTLHITWIWLVTIYFVTTFGLFCRGGGGLRVHLVLVICSWITVSYIYLPFTIVVLLVVDAVTWLPRYTRWITVTFVVTLTLFYLW